MVGILKGFVLAMGIDYVYCKTRPLESPQLSYAEKIVIWYKRKKQAS